MTVLLSNIRSQLVGIYIEICRREAGDSNIIRKVGGVGRTPGVRLHEKIAKKIVLEKEIQARIPLEMTLMTPLTVFNMLLDYC